MKKYLALLLAVLMVLTALAGCSSQQAETTTPDAPAAATGNTPETETPDTQPDETTTSGEKQNQLYGLGHGRRNRDIHRDD